MDKSRRVRALYFYKKGIQMGKVKEAMLNCDPVDLLNDRTEKNKKLLDLYSDWKQEDLNDAIKKLVKSLKEDEGYRISWVANIAMAFMDQHNEVEHQFYDSHMENSLHKTANEAAEHFIKVLCREYNE